MKLGVETGDWRYFAQADDIIYQLDNIYTVTKDQTIFEASNALFDQVEEVKGFLEKKYGVSIYALKDAIKSEQEQAPKQADPEIPGKQSPFQTSAISEPVQSPHLQSLYRNPLSLAIDQFLKHPRNQLLSSH